MAAFAELSELVEQVCVCIAVIPVPPFQQGPSPSWEGVVPHKALVGFVGTHRVDCIAQCCLRIEPQNLVSTVLQGP